MIITAQEYRNMGFSWANDSELSGAIQRAEYVIAALTDGRAAAALAAGGRAAGCVKQAVAFQADQILHSEYPEGSSGSSSSSESGEERVSIGDFSYTRSQSGSQSGSRNDVSVEPFDTSMTIIGLLRSAGCLFGGLEAAE